MVSMCCVLGLSSLAGIASACAVPSVRVQHASLYGEVFSVRLSAGPATAQLPRLPTPTLPLLNAINPLFTHAAQGSGFWRGLGGLLSRAGLGQLTRGGGLTRDGLLGSGEDLLALLHYGLRGGAPRCVSGAVSFAVAFGLHSFS